MLVVLEGEAVEQEEVEVAAAAVEVAHFFTRQDGPSYIIEESNVSAALLIGLRFLA